MQHTDSLLEQLKKINQPEVGNERIFLKVRQIQSIGNKPTFAFGTNILTNQQIKIRLNNVEEGIKHLIKNHRLPYAQAEQQVKQQYLGTNARESLEAKRDKRKAAYLCFERCVAISNAEEDVPAYRSHWAELISANPEAEILNGVATIQIRQVTPTRQWVKRDTAWVELVESISPLEPSNLQNNLHLVKQALNNHHGDGMPRSGYAVFQLFKNEQLYSEVKVFQQRKIVHCRDHNNNSTEFLTAVCADETLNEFLYHEKNNKINELAILKDIAKVTLGALAGFQLHQKYFSSSDPRYLHSLRQLYADLKKGTITARIICVNTILFGPDAARNIIKKAQRTGPLSIYQQRIKISPGLSEPIPKAKPLYLPTTIAIHRYRDSNRAYAVFCLPTTATATIKPCLLSELNSDLVKECDMLGS